ncbi:MAG TPA: pyridoxal phosphate-dependent aminotransferase [Burkholderiales bacterium]|nr:pyridoxal phosphate-dependent aminotransferase [Burkholderiales bacterium]
MNRPEQLPRTWNGPLASRLEEIEPFHVVVLINRAKELEAAGRTISNMVVGEPDAPVPPRVAEAGMRAIKGGRIGYTPSLGITDLREAIAGFYKSRYGVDVPCTRIAVTTGSSGALLLTMGTLLSPGSQVLMADPGYPCNRHFVRTLEGEAVGIPVGADTAYQLTAALVEKHWTPRTAAVLIASPSNPTGTLIDHDELARIHAVTKARGGVLIVDEIYHGLTYGKRDRSALEFADDVFIINSFSKYFGMTGWRLGWVVMPEQYVQPLDKLAQNLFISPSDLAQKAALAAFHPETLALLEQRRDAFKAQRDFLLPALRDLGFDIPVTPEGAFYIYANCERLTDDSYAFCQDLLETAGVAVAPGIDFGTHKASGHVRFSYPKPIPVLEQGVERLRKYLGKR